MSMKSMKQVLLILNPRAGKCKGSKKLSDILEILQKGGCITTVMITGKAGDARRYACEYCGAYDIVVCIGGDGTFSEVVSGIVSGHHDIPIGYIPAGSANDYASSLGLSFDLCVAARDIVSGMPKYYDIGRFNQQPFAYVVAFGSFAKISYNAPQDLKNVLGHFAYILEGIKDLHNLHPEHVRIETDEEQFEGDYLLGIFSNAMSIGGLLRYDKEMIGLNDGYLELMLIEMPTTPWEFSQMIQAMSNREYNQSSRIIFRRSKRISIHTDAIIPWTLDGERAEADNDVDICNVPNAIQVIVPMLPNER